MRSWPCSVCQDYHNSVYEVDACREEVAEREAEELEEEGNQ